MEPADPQPETHRPVSPELSHVSVKTIRSMFESPHLSSGPPQPDPQAQTPRAVSPVPSCVSMKSDGSMGQPPRFSSGPPQPDPEAQTPRAVSPVPSCVSMKSDWSMGQPPRFSSGPPQPDPEAQTPRAVSPVPSCVSMKSDGSMGQPPRFSSGPPQSDPETPDHPWCGVCEQLLRDPVITTCGHSFCRQCVSSYWSQSAPSGNYSCPQCKESCRTQPVVNPDATMAQPPAYPSTASVKLTVHQQLLVPDQYSRALMY
ncbi:hypothetical protein ACEWY4_017421 [Coilia grayii]|uniref:RING-type domain-containing protein n=1 Tax=Coilia grayii TaxID=363190 RepID=A0ABD1JGS1_9TELE